MLGPGSQKPWDNEIGWIPDLLNIDAMACTAEDQTCAHCLCESSCLMPLLLAYLKLERLYDLSSIPDSRSLLDPPLGS